MVRAIFDLTFYGVRVRLVAYLNYRMAWVQLRDLIQFKTCLVDFGACESKINNANIFSPTLIMDGELSRNFFYDK